MRKLSTSLPSWNDAIASETFIWFNTGLAWPQGVYKYVTVTGDCVISIIARRYNQPYRSVSYFICALRRKCMLFSTPFDHCAHAFEWPYIRFDWPYIRDLATLIMFRSLRSNDMSSRQVARILFCVYADSINQATLLRSVLSWYQYFTRVIWYIVLLTKVILTWQANSEKRLLTRKMKLYLLFFISFLPVIPSSDTCRFFSATAVGEVRYRKPRNKELIGS